MSDIVQPLLIESAMLQCPELRGEEPRRRLEERRQIKVIGAEADAEAAQRRPTILIETAHLLQNLRPLEHAEGFGDLKGDTARDAREGSRLFELQQRPEQPHDMRLEPRPQTRLDFFAGRPG